MTSKENNKAKNFARKVRNGEAVRGAMLNFPCGEIVELLGLAGLDFVMLDAEHGCFSERDIETHCRAADAVDIATLVRVVDNREGTILRALDRGVTGIVVPHIRSADDAWHSVTYSRFAPDGTRSYGSARANAYDSRNMTPENLAQANDELLVIGLLEDAEALENLDEILEVDGIDSYLIGPHDLALSLGKQDIRETIQAMTERIRAANRSFFGDVAQIAMVGRWITDAAQQMGKKDAP